MKKILLITACLSLTLCALGASPACAEDDILINDFEAAGYGDWTVEGKAFGKAPAKGTLAGQMHVPGFEGKGLVNTFLGGDKPTGKLTSPEFTIQRDYIKYLIGGGGHKGKTCMNLLLDGEVVLTATGPNLQPGGSEFLNWENWDVKPYRGKTAVLEIVDLASGGWGHINVDQIAQTDTPAKKKPAPQVAGVPSGETFERTVTPTKKYLLFPVNDKAPAARVILKPEVGGELQFTMGMGDKENVDFWGHVALAPYADKPISLTVTGATQEGFDSIVQADSVPYVSNLYDEPLRPQFHFSQKVGWNNDPNGMCYANGEYHLFFQHNPFGWKWGNMTWGHAVSKDLVHWTQLENALVFDKRGTMFSGTGAVDKDNTAGFKTGDKDVIVLAYTYAGRFGYPPCPYTQAIAYSNDNGRTFVKYQANPVVPNISGGSDRDPKILWHESTKKWVMVLYLANGKRFGFFTSDKLKEWKQVSEMGGFHECPELFELPVDGDENNTRWVIFGADAQYFIGSFDGKEFRPDHVKKHRVHHGQYYASQTFNQTPDGRRIQIGWARIAMPGMPFNQSFTVPTRLTLRTTDDGIRMFATPVKEIEQLRKPDPQSVANTELTAESPAVTLDVADQLFDIEVIVRRGTAARAVLKFGENVATYDFNAQKLDEMPLKMKDGKVTFRVLVDRPMYELVGGGGVCYKTSARRDMGQSIGKISLTAELGSLVIESFDVHEMKSIWDYRRGFLP